MYTHALAAHKGCFARLSARPIGGLEIAAKDGHRSRGQRKGRRGIRIYRRRGDGAIRISSAAIEPGMPLVLRFAECFHRDRTGEGTGARRGGVGERDVHLVRIFLILVDDQQGPRAVRARGGVSRDQNVVGSIANVAFR